VLEDEAVVLHFDSPSFVDWRAKFRARAASVLKQEDVVATREIRPRRL